MFFVANPLQPLGTYYKERLDGMTAARSGVWPVVGVYLGEPLTADGFYDRVVSFDRCVVLLEEAGAALRATGDTTDWPIPLDLAEAIRIPSLGSPFIRRDGVSAIHAARLMNTYNLEPLPNELADAYKWAEVIRGWIDGIAAWLVHVREIHGDGFVTSTTLSGSFHKFVAQHFAVREFKELWLRLQQWVHSELSPSIWIDDVHAFVSVADAKVFEARRLEILSSGVPQLLAKEALDNYPSSPSNRGVGPAGDSLTDEEMQAIGRHLAELDYISPGNNHAEKYKVWVAKALEYIFGPVLTDCTVEQPLDMGLKRCDVVFANRGDTGFFQWIRQSGISSQYVIVECKNYSDDIENPEIDQLLGRFSRERGSFGILACRVVTDRRRLLQRCKAAVQGKGEYVIVLEDEDFRVLLTSRASNRLDAIEEHMRRKHRSLVM